MANATAIDENPTILEATSSPQSVTLNPRKRYTIFHDGLEDDDSTVSTGNIYISRGIVDPDDTGDEGQNNFRLKNGRALTIGPGWTAFSFEAAAGSPTMSVIPDGELLHNA
jgi:hypothetical protein